MLSDDGESYLLDGVKLWTTNGVIAELVVVMARVPSHTDADGTEHKGGISAFVVEMNSPPASPWRTATPSWACAESRTGG